MYQKGSVHLLVLILIVLGIGALGYYSWRSKLIVYKPDNSIPSPTSTSSDCIDDISNWETYNNHYYGFSIKYPSCWKIYSSEDAASEQLMYFIISSKDYKFIVDFKQELYQVSDSSFEKNSDHWRDYYIASTAELGNSKVYAVNKESIIIDGVSAIKNTISYQFGHMENPGTTHWIYIPLNNEMRTKKILLSVKYYSETANENELELYEKILSTFKFIR